MLAAFCQAGPAKNEGRACFELLEVEKPSLQGLPVGTVLLQTVASSICGSDLWGKNVATGRGAMQFLNSASKPTCGGSGHEIIGKVVDIVQPCNTKLFVGQLVLAMAPAYIKRIESLKNTFEKETNQDVSVLPEGGGFAQYIVSHSCTCIPLPAETTLPNPLYFVAAQPLGTILHACTKLGSVIGKTVAVVGQGQNGLIMTQMLANMGARKIIVFDLFAERLQVSKQFKATHVFQFPQTHNEDEMQDAIQVMKQNVSEITQGSMVDFSIDMVGHQGKTLDFCAQLTRDYGTVLLFGLPPSPEEDGMTIRARDFTRNLHYVCSHSPSMDEFEFAVELLQQGRFDPTPLFTHVIPFEDFPRAYEMASEYRDDVIKILLTYDGCVDET